MITNGYGASSAGSSFSTIYWLLNISVKKQRELLVHTIQVNNFCTFKVRCVHFTTGWEIDKEVVDGLVHVKEVGNKHSEAFLQDSLAQDKKSFFDSFYKTRLNWKWKGKEIFKTHQSWRSFVKLLVSLLTKQWKLL